MQVQHEKNLAIPYHTCPQGTMPACQLPTVPLGREGRAGTADSADGGGDSLAS